MTTPAGKEATQQKARLPVRKYALIKYGAENMETQRKRFAMHTRAEGLRTHKHIEVGRDCARAGINETHTVGTEAPRRRRNQDPFILIVPAHALAHAPRGEENG